MAKVPGLVRQGAKYYYRRAVPKDLQLVAQKKEIWIALQTSDYHRAGRLAREAAVSTDAYLTELRTGQTQVKDAAEIFDRPVSELDLHLVAKKHLWQRERQDVPAQAVLDVREDYLARLLTADDEESQVMPGLMEEAGRLASDAFPQIAPRSFEEKFGHVSLSRMEAPKPQFLKLVELVRRAEIEHVRRSIDRIAGDHGDKAHDPMFADVTSFDAQPKVSSDRGISVGALIDRFKSDPRREGYTESANKKYIMTFRVLEEVVGADYPVRDISRQQCAEVQELLAALPSNLRKRREFDGLSLRECALRRDELGAPSLSPGSVKVYTQTLSAFFNYAIDRGVIEHNPAARLSTGKTKRLKKGRGPYSIEQINLLISCLRDWSGDDKPARYWIPIIALFSGMRMGEIVSLSLGELVEIRGHGWGFQLRHTEQRPLKTPGSERLVPLHPVLVQIGFLKYVEDCRKKGGDLIFPEITGSEHKKRATNFQHRFEYYQKKKMKIVEKGVSFHSFRHNFRDALRECGVPRDITTALGGWKEASVEERYGQGPSSATLFKWMAKVEYPGLNLDPILRRKLG